MVMSQSFPDYYDGIVAGAPVYDSQAVGLSGLWADKAIEAIAPAPIQKLSDGSPILIQRFRKPIRSCLPARFLRLAPTIRSSATLMMAASWPQLAFQREKSVDDGARRL